MSDDERMATSRMPWFGQRVCVRCQKVGFGVDEEGVCQSCRTEERKRQEFIDWLSDMAKKGGDDR